MGDAFLINIYASLKKNLYFSIQVCNGSEYCRVPGDVMKILWYQKQQVLASGNNAEPEEFEYTGKFGRKLRQIMKLNDQFVQADEEDSKTDIKGDGAGYVDKLLGAECISDAGQIFEFDGFVIDSKTVLLNGKVSLKVESVPRPVVDKVDLFYCCATCGKVFWDGSHYEKVCKQFADVLNID